MAGRSTGSLDVFLRLHGQRKFAKEVAASGAELEAMGVKGAAAMARFAASGEKLKKFGRSWTHNVTLPVAALGFVAGKMAVDFHQAMSLVQTQAGASAKETKFLEGAVLNFAKNSKFGPTEVANALFRVRSAGFKAREALDVLKQGMNLSTVGNSDLEMTTKALTGAAKSLHMEKPGQLRGLAAEMNAIVGTGDMRMEELQDALSTGVLPAFVSAGMGIRDYGTALTVMTDRNVPAQVASTRLRTAVAMLVPHTKKAEEALEGVGVQGETLANLMRHQGLPATIEYLAGKLDKLSKNRANKTMIEAFGGSKSSATIEMLVENADELGKKWNLIAGGVGKYQHQIKVAEEQPGFKLAKAWSSIQVALVKLGDELLPVVVPGFEKLASTFSSVAHVFVGLPTNVQAAAVGFLLLTGPIASGLGYFAGGLGRVLILTNKIAQASSLFRSTLSPTMMTQRSGIGGAFGAASEKMGISGAMQTAKGFAYSLGPAVAAYGIGNIITSATSSDWQDAGFEAGGALAGGIAGFMLGDPMGAMLGVGIGSLGGELLSGLFTSAPKISLMHRELDHLTASTSGYHAALKGLPSANHAAQTAEHKHSKAVKEEHRAQKGLAQALASFGVESEPATRAQIRLDRAQRRVTRSAHAERNAHRLAGNALKVYRMRSLEEVASIKQVLPLLNKRVKVLNRHLNKDPHNLKLAERTLKTERRQASARRELTEVYAQSEAKGGKPWTHRLEALNTLQAQFGTKGKVLVDRLGEQRSKMAELTKTGYKYTGAWKEIQSAIGETLRELERFQAQTEGIAPKRPQGTHNHPSFGRVPQGTGKGKGGKHGGGGNSATAGTSSLLFSPSASPISFQNGGPIDVHIHVQNDNVLHLDGEKVAENTTRHSQRRANRE